jgi:hypothetical protein
MKLSPEFLLALTLMAGPAAAADLCATATASATLAELTIKEALVQARGTWQSGGSAAGVILEYRFDSDRLQTEGQAGPSGTWHMAQDITSYGCANHTLRVTAVPYVQDGVSQVHCLNRSTYVKQTFAISCAPVAEIVDCQWECTGGKEPHCTGNCTGAAHRGKLSYLPYWGVNGDAWQPADTPGEGPFAQAVSCVPGQRISFKVRDRDGRGNWSDVVELGCGVTE